MGDIIGSVSDLDVTAAPADSARDPAQSPEAPGNIIGSIDDQDVETHEAHFGSPLQQLGTGLEGAAKAVSFGLSSPVEAKVGQFLKIPELGVEAQEAREKENPISSVVGGIGGFASGFGAAGEIAAAGKAASQAIGSRALSQAVKYGVEGMLLQGGNETAKLLNADPNQTAGTAAINVGLSGLIGGAIGGASSLWAAKFGPKVASALESADGAVNSGGPAAQAAGLGPEQVSGLQEGLSSLKENAPDIQEALNRLNIEPTVGTLSGSKTIQSIEGNLAERPSLPGVALNNERQAVTKKLGQAAASTLDNATAQSEASIGKQIKSDISAKLLEKLKPIEDGYSKAESGLKSVQVGDSLKEQALQPILDHDFVRLDPQSASLAKQLSGQINNIENLSDLKKVRTLISSKLSAAFGSGEGSGPKAQILQVAKDALTELRTKALTRAAEAEIVSPEILENIRNLDGQYAEFQGQLKQLGVEAGLGKANNARSLLARFSSLSDESFTKKVFDTGDAGNLEFFRRNFPEAFDKARRFKLGEIYDASVDHAQGKNGTFSTQKFLTQVRKLSVEAQQSIFKAEDLQKLRDIELVHQAIPGTPNTSGTSYAEAFAKLFSPSGIVQNLSDAAQYAFLKALPHVNEAADLAGGDTAAKLGALKFLSNSEKGADPTAFKSMVDYIRATIRGQNTLSSSVKNLFDASKAVLPEHLLPDQSSRDRLEKALDFASNPSNALNVGAGVGHYLPSHATAQAQITASAVNYLNGLKPKQPVMSPLDTPPPIGKAAQNSYNRALDIAQQPLTVLQHVKNGTLLPRDVETLQTLYPGLHKQMVQLVTNHLINNKAQIPYRQRVSLNSFMGGAPLDSTMTPGSMQAIIHSSSPQSQAMAQQTKGHGRNGASASTLSQVNKVNALYQTPLERRQVQKGR